MRFYLAARWIFPIRAAAIFLSCSTAVLLVALAIVKIEPFLRPIAPAFEETAPRLGEPAPDFTLKDIEGEPYHLAEHLGRPLVLEFGSFT